MGQTDLKPTAQGQVESSINDTINFIMAKVAAGEIDAATATELIAAARKDYESNVPVTTSPAVKWDVVGLFDEIHKPNKTFRSVIRLNPCAHLLQIGRVCRDELLRKQVQVLEMAKLVKEQPRAEGNAIIIRDIDFLML